MVSFSLFNILLGMIRNGLLLLLLSCSQNLFSQRIMEVNYQLDQQGNYNFYCKNNAYCNYILEIGFGTLDNMKSDIVLPYRGMMKPGMNKLFKLSKQNASEAFQFKYSIDFAKGCINPKTDTNFTYLLPLSQGKETQVYVMQNDQQTSSKESSVGGNAQEINPGSKNWYLVRMRMKPGDTIFSARRGMVTEVDDKSDANDVGGSSIGNENYVEIVHGDCSFGRYGILKKGSALVKPGQFVEAGTPIGLVGGDKFGRGSEIRFSVHYNVEPGDSQYGSNAKIYWEYVPLKFWTKSNGKISLKHGANYISEFPKEILQQEIKKPDVKKGKKK
ncbi:MAG: M23 family metallopeptidase [Bacteroidetes bacterium]|nr:M23 family metallopeptidase [Bacteroidota bacterium]